VERSSCCTMCWVAMRPTAHASRCTGPADTLRTPPAYRPLSLRRTRAQPRLSRCIRAWWVSRRAVRGAGAVQLVKKCRI
jgi:hypothetical protein